MNADAQFNTDVQNHVGAPLEHKFCQQQKQKT